MNCIFLIEINVSYLFINPTLNFTEYSFESDNPNFSPFNIRLNNEYLTFTQIRFGLGFKVKIYRLGFDVNLSTSTLPLKWYDKNEFFGTSILSYGLNWVMGKNKRNYRSISEGEKKFEKKYRDQKESFNRLKKDKIKAELRHGKDLKSKDIKIENQISQIQELNM